MLISQGTQEYTKIRGAGGPQELLKKLSPVLSEQERMRERIFIFSKVVASRANAVQMTHLTKEQIFQCVGEEYQLWQIARSMIQTSYCVDAGSRGIPDMNVIQCNLRSPEKVIIRELPPGFTVLTHIPSSSSRDKVSELIRFHMQSVTISHLPPIFLQIGLTSVIATHDLEQDYVVGILKDKGKILHNLEAYVPSLKLNPIGDSVGRESRHGKIKNLFRYLLIQQQLRIELQLTGGTYYVGAFLVVGCGDIGYHQYALMQSMGCNFTCVDKVKLNIPKGNFSKRVGGVYISAVSGSGKTYFINHYKGAAPVFDLDP